jgi:hypothetical protein
MSGDVQGSSGVVITIDDLRAPGVGWIGEVARQGDLHLVEADFSDQDMAPFLECEAARRFEQAFKNPTGDPKEYMLLLSELEKQARGFRSQLRRTRLSAAGVGSARLLIHGYDLLQGTGAVVNGAIGDTEGYHDFERRYMFKTRIHKLVRGGDVLILPPGLTDEARVYQCMAYLRRIGIL